MTRNPDLEVRFRWLSILIVALFAVALTTGLVLHLSAPGTRLSVQLLQAGLVALMVAPAARILVAVAERVRRRDWPFVLMTAIVIAELAIVLWRAASKA